MKNMPLSPNVNSSGKFNMEMIIDDKQINVYYEHLLEVTVNSVSYIFDLDDDSLP